MKYYQLFIDRINPVTKKFDGGQVDLFSPVVGKKELLKDAREGKYTDSFYPEGFFYDYLQIDETTYRFKNWKIRDLASGIDCLDGAKGLIFNSKLKSLLDQFNLAPHRFYGARLRVKKIFYDDFHVVQFLENSYLNCGDYSKFIFTELDGNMIQITNGKEYYFKNDNEVSEEQSKLIKNINQLREKAGDPYLDTQKMPNYLGVKKIVFNSKGAEIDLMWHGRVGWLVSERLTNALIENKITGIKLEELKNIEFVVE
jgi:hypothetical protein